MPQNAFNLMLRAVEYIAVFDTKIGRGVKRLRNTIRFWMATKILVDFK